jgi:hypothetical protein
MTNPEIPIIKYFVHCACKFRRELNLFQISKNNSIGAQKSNNFFVLGFYPQRREWPFILKVSHQTLNSILKWK